MKSGNLWIDLFYVQDAEPEKYYEKHKKQP